MKKFLGSWRTSILIRVTATTLALTTLLFLVVGVLLSNQISAGINRSKLESSINEGKSTIDALQSQLDETRYRQEKKARDIISQVFKTSEVDPTRTQREAIILATPDTAKTSKIFQGSSSYLDFATITPEFRTAVRKDGFAHSMQGRIRYINGITTNGIIVGRLLFIPENQIYEIYYLFPLTQEESLMRFINILLMISLFILLLMIGLITWNISGRIVRPVREAAEIAEELTAGDLSRRIAVRGEDELARLAVAFNEMGVSLQQQISRLENLSRLQQRFVSDVSHELRTPLTTIRMASQVLFDSRHNLDPASSRSAELLMAQIIRFESLLADLIEVSRFDARAAILATQGFDISTIVRRVVDELHANEEVKVVCPEESVIAQIDARRIERILRNLISNAIDHSEGKDVVVTVAENESAVSVGVRDYGIGFTERDGERLFDRFWRADPSRSRLRGGTGLGLSIAIDDAKLHQGTIKAWGRPNAGAHFVLSIPKSAGIPMTDEAIPAIPSDAPSTEFTSFDIDDV